MAAPRGCWQHRCLFFPLVSPCGARCEDTMTAMASSCSQPVLPRVVLAHIVDFVLCVDWYRRRSFSVASLQNIERQPEWTALLNRRRRRRQQQQRRGARKGWVATGETKQPSLSTSRSSTTATCTSTCSRYCAIILVLDYLYLVCHEQGFFFCVHGAERLAASSVDPVHWTIHYVLARDF